MGMVMKEENVKRVTRMAEQRIALDTEHRKEKHDLTATYEQEFHEEQTELEEWTKGYMQLEEELQGYKEWYAEGDAWNEAAPAGAAACNLEDELEMIGAELPLKDCSLKASAQEFAPEQPTPKAPGINITSLQQSISRMHTENVVNIEDENNRRSDERR